MVCRPNLPNLTPRTVSTAWIQVNTAAFGIMRTRLIPNRHNINKRTELTKGTREGSDRWMERNTRLGARVLFDIFHPSVCSLLLTFPHFFPSFPPFAIFYGGPGATNWRQNAVGVMAARGKIKDERRREPSFRRLINAISLAAWV